MAIREAARFRRNQILDAVSANLLTHLLIYVAHHRVNVALRQESVIVRRICAPPAISLKHPEPLQ